MKNLLLCFSMVIFTCFPWQAKSQSCECTDCPILILDNSISTSCLDISGLTNPTLNVAGQSVCGIDIQFDHTWLNEVSIKLIAPDGSFIFLVADNTGGSTNNATWDIDFIPCSGTAAPDPGFPAIFTSTGYNNGNFTGTYFPGDGCFEDLTGNANGTWKLEIEDFASLDEGEITFWSITFCDGTGTECGPAPTCIADAGTYSLLEQEVCINAPNLMLAPAVSGEAPAPEYGYTFTISNISGGTQTDIITYSDDADFAGFAPGYYWVCGLSYLVTDEPLLPSPDGTLTNADIQTDIDNMEYCADISSDCFVVQLDDEVEAPIFTFPETLCADEVGELVVLNYDPNYLWLVADINGSFSSFNVLAFPFITYSGSGTTDEVEICIEFVSACGNMTTCASTVIIDGIETEPEILGETETCYGNTYEYTISSTDGMVSYNWFINPNEDSFIIGSSTDPSVVVGLPDDPDQFSASICFEYEDICGNIDEVCLYITPQDVIFEDDLTPDSFCGLVGDFNIIANGSGTGSWVQNSGPGTSVFNDANVLNTTVTVSEVGVYSFTYSTECGNMITVDIEFFEFTEEPQIEGILIACAGELLSFSAFDIEPNIILEWFAIGDGDIVGASDQSTVDVLLADPGNGFTTQICLEYQNPCADINVICEFIEFTLDDLDDLTQTDVCDLNFTLNVQVNGMEWTGQWIFISGPGTAIIDNELNSVTTAEVDAFGDYVFEFSSDICGAIIQVPVTVNSELEIENLIVDCIGEDFIVSFDIIGGEEPYSINGTNIPSSTFISSQLSGDTYLFIIGDNSSCADIEVMGDSNCECESDAGTIGPQDFLVSCNDELIAMFSNGDEFLDANDGAIFILYTDLLDPFGSIALENTTGIFTFTPPLQYGVVYYVAYVVGDALGGSVDFIDPCVDFATGTSILFSEPFDFSGIGFSEIVSCNIILELTSLQSSNDLGEWSVDSAPVGGTVIFNGVNGISTIATFSDAGTYVIRYAIDNGFCSDSQEVTLEVTEFDGFMITNVSYICDDLNENYQVSFDIEGGVEPYIVGGELLSGNTFISGLIPSGNMEMFPITDANGCTPFIFTSDFTCIDNCTSYAEMVLTDLEELCEGDNYTASESGNSVLEGDDIGVFILHTNAGNVLGTILDQNTDGDFSYIPILDFGTVYYISYIVGNEVAGDIDLSDECLSVTPGQSIVFYEEPDVEIDYDALVCSFEIDISLDISIGESWLWSTLSNPTSSNVEFTDFTNTNVSISVDQGGEYVFLFYLENGTCFSYDTVQIEFLTEPSSLVMDDFSTCDYSFDIFSITDGSPATWEVLSTQAYLIVDASFDSTSITFDDSGVFEIVRKVGEGICTAADTLTVEVFDESSFVITDIICDEDKLTYSVEYSIDGNSYPYIINGEIINEGETIDLISNSGDSLLIYVIDANQCEIFNETIFNSCDCESEPGIMSPDLVEVCLDETLSVMTIEDAVLEGSDSLVYVLHTSSGTTIIDILFVSSSAVGFNFIPATMMVNTIYYISPVVFNGGVFDINTLNEICTKVAPGTPVLWSSENTIELPGILSFCEGETVEITVIYMGVVPVSLKLIDDSFNSYDLDITQEGESMFTLDIEASSGFVVELFIPLPCPLEVIGELKIKFKSPPILVFASDIVVCNSSITGSTIVLDDLIIVSNSFGSWFDPNGNLVSGTIDFDGFSAGEYAYQFVSSGNEPCEEASFTIPITVEECDCPMDIFLPFEGLCQGDYSINLEEFLEVGFAGLGSWSVTSLSGSGDLGLQGSELTIGLLNVGTYQVTFTFDELPQGCDEAYSFDIEIGQLLNSGTVALDQIEICIGDLLEIVLFDYLEDYDAGGEWKSQSGILIDILTGLVDLSLADAGLFTFEYEIPASEFCPSSTTEISILINNPIELFFSILDPVCFGQNDGSVSVEDSNGLPVDFDLYNEALEIVSNPDSLFAGEYDVSVIDENGCVIVQNFTLLDPLELFLELGEDRIVEEGEVTEISPVLVEGGSISLYQWFANQAILDSPTFDTLLISPDGETYIQLIITDEDGCIVADDLLLTILDEKVNVVLANVFNPLSNSFGIEAFEEITLVNSFSIYDRWGSLMFAENNFSPADQSKKWDGTFNGSFVTNGVYVFSISYTNSEGRIVSIFGDVTVVRL